MTSTSLGFAILFFNTLAKFAHVCLKNVLVIQQKIGGEGGNIRGVESLSTNIFLPTNEAILTALPTVQAATTKIRPMHELTKYCSTTNIFHCMTIKVDL